MIEILRDNGLLFLIGQYPYGPLGGLAMTLIISIASLALSFPCAVLLALARLSPYRPLRAVAFGVVYTVRGIPLIMLIFWVYFAFPMLFGYSVGGVATIIASLVVYKAAYLGEIIRAGILALPKGQTEAARALGLGYGVTTFRIILPQALFNMLPSMLSQFVGIVKDSSLGYVIGAHELTFAANQVNATLLTKPLEVFTILALIFFAINFLLTSAAQLLERRLQRSRSRSFAPPATAEVATA